MTLQEKENIMMEYEKNSKYLEIYFNGGLTFEDKVMHELHKKYKDGFIMINTDGRCETNKKNFEKTKKAMMDGIPIISQAVTFNEKNNTCGVADLLVTSDYINIWLNFQLYKKKKK